MELLSEEGYTYMFTPSACEACGGHCCTGETGYIWAKYEEIDAMASFLTLSIEEFATRYLRKVKHRYSLIEKQLAPDNFACIFFDESKKRCSIYPVRPLQCRTFPFWEQFKNNEEEVRKECPGIV
ncbi:MAG TPA: YkgJ family cysteine cluster protein [Sulfurovum sp.]|nr:YkgJ family cysteine cluster protein [Sulfurovum sp.]HQS73319.1 YkgJ family cysteine cluster protein [Sulfurovum sp.]HQS78000.1 YkgJ family cysteine cluster protein [Sulfurovum sp.]HQT28058.1 YkgJ family cysteine cluster protein [Sulfurovum sp.]